MTKIHKIEETITWAEGRKRSEAGKYTFWSSSKDYSQLGGFTIENMGWHTEGCGDTRLGSLKLTAHTSHGLSFCKNFDIPLDNVKEFCDTLMRVRDRTLKHIDNDK